MKNRYHRKEGFMNNFLKNDKIIFILKYNDI